MKVKIAGRQYDTIPMNQLQPGQFAIIRTEGGSYDGHIVMASYKSSEFLLLDKYESDLDSFNKGCNIPVEVLPKGTKLEITIL